MLYHTIVFECNCYIVLLAIPLIMYNAVFEAFPAAAVVWFDITRAKPKSQSLTVSSAPTWRVRRNNNVNNTNDDNSINMNTINNNKT